MNNVEEVCDGGHTLAHFVSEILILSSDLVAALMLTGGYGSKTATRGPRHPRAPARITVMVSNHGDGPPAGAILRALDAVVVV